MSHRAKILLIIFIIIIILSGIGFWIWYRYFSTYAETIYGCQGTAATSSILGPPGSNLIAYNLFGKDVSVNKEIAPYLDNVQKQVNALNTGYVFNDVQTYNYRSVRGGGGLSKHSWGSAIDINPGQNAQGSGRGDIPQSILDVFAKNGFFWGGNWEGRASDPMHFEWYGAKVYGSFLDSQSNQKITSSLAAMIDNNPASAGDGGYLWVVDSLNPHKVKVVARGYEDLEFDLSLTCFESKPLNIYLKPLPENLPGTVSGRVTLANNLPLLMPATISLDGKIVGASNIRGEYYIANVRRGVHKVEAKILMFPGASTTTADMIPGENLNNVNIVIGK